MTIFRLASILWSLARCAGATEDHSCRAASCIGGRQGFALLQSHRSESIGTHQDDAADSDNDKAAGAEVGIGAIDKDVGSGVSHLIGHSLDTGADVEVASGAATKASAAGAGTGNADFDSAGLASAATETDLKEVQSRRASRMEHSKRAQDWPGEQAEKRLMANAKRDHTQDMINSAKGSVPTCGDNGGRVACVFPFTYKGNTYNACTSVDDTEPWCATTHESDESGSARPSGWCMCPVAPVAQSSTDCSAYTDAQEIYACREECPKLQSAGVTVSSCITCGRRCREQTSLDFVECHIECLTEIPGFDKSKLGKLVTDEGEILADVPP